MLYPDILSRNRTNIDPINHMSSIQRPRKFEAQIDQNEPSPLSSSISSSTQELSPHRRLRRIRRTLRFPPTTRLPTFASARNRQHRSLGPHPTLSTHMPHRRRSGRHRSLLEINRTTLSILESILRRLPFSLAETGRRVSSCGRGHRAHRS